MKAFKPIVLENSRLKPRAWFQYVAGTFITWPHGGDILDSFIGHPNTQHPDIKFTKGVENNGVIPSLDVLVRCKPNGPLGIAAATDGSKLTEEVIGASKMLSFFDSFFDSLIGNVKRAAKPLKGYIEAGSPDFEFYGNAKQVLKTMYFVDSNIKKRGLPGKIRFIKGRTFNQDPLENSFCQMRQRGVRNVNPATMFKFHFPTLLINNIGTRHSINANCEVDTNLTLTSVLQLLTFPPEICTVENINDEMEKLMKHSCTDD
ncbi:hypothetical protein Trydic_g21717 [Trypoxylus dichotomus]